MHQTDNFPGFKKFFAKKTKKREHLTIIVLERNETAFLSPDGVLRFKNINGVRVPLSNLSIFFGPAVGRADGWFKIKEEDEKRKSFVSDTMK